MAEDRRMTVADVVAAVLAHEHGDFVREAVAIVARELMEAGVSAEIGRPRRGVGGAHDAPQRLPEGCHHTCRAFSGVGCEDRRQSGAETSYCATGSRRRSNGAITTPPCSTGSPSWTCVCRVEVMRLLSSQESRGRRASVYADVTGPFATGSPSGPFCAAATKARMNQCAQELHLADQSRTSATSLAERRPRCRSRCG